MAKPGEPGMVRTAPDPEDLRVKCGGCARYGVGCDKYPSPRRYSPPLDTLRNCLEFGHKEKASWTIKVHK